MANTVSAFYQTLVCAATEAAATLVGQTKFLDWVYKDIRSDSGALGQTIDVPLPGNSGSAITDVGLNDFTLNDISYGNVPIVFNKHPGGGFIVRSFEQYNSPQDIRQGFLDSYIKAVAESANATLAALVTTANFPNYPIITSGTPGIIDSSSITQAMGYLANAKIPVTDLGNFYLGVNPFPYFQMAGSTFWSAESQIGYQIATEVRKRAMLGQQFGAEIDYDQQMPVTDTAFTGTAALTNGSANVVGTSTTFTNLKVGQFIRFGTDTIPYQVAVITDATHITLGSAYVGTTASGVAIVTRAFANFLFHKHAIAMVTRPLPQPDSRVVYSTYIDWKGLPMRVQLGWNQIKNGWCVTVDAGFGCAVLRNDHGIIITN